MKRFEFAVVAVAVAAVGLWGRLACAEENWQVEVGPIRQWGIKMQVDGPPLSLSQAPWFLLPGANSKVVLNQQTTGTLPGAADVAPPPDDLQLGNRTFDDGFVRLDVWTLDPGVQQPERAGTTWNWGYQNASQYDPQALTLTFHRTTAASASARVSETSVSVENQTTCDVQRDDAVNADDKTSADGVQVNAKRHWRTWGKWRLEVNAGAAWFPNIETATSANPFLMLIRQNTYRVSEQQVDTTYRGSYLETYTYGDEFGRLDPTLPPLPDVVGPLPYNGPADPVNGPGPLLPNRPEQYSVDATGGELTKVPAGSSRTKELIGSRAWLVSDSVDWDADLNRLRLVCGPELTRAINGRIRPHLAPQLTLNVVEADVDRRETGTVTDAASGRVITTAVRTNHGDETDCILGLLIVAGSDVQLSEHWVLIADVGYEWLEKKMSVDVGPDQAKFDLEGWDASVRVGRQF